MTDSEIQLDADSIDEDPLEETVDPPKPIIARIKVKDLFGRYSYDIRPYTSDFPNGDENRLVILYGENGTGKTTILSLVFDLLSPAHNKAHRSIIGTTPFTEFLVHLSNGTSVCACREEGALKGDFRFMIYRADEALVDFEMKVDREGKIDLEQEDRLQVTAELEKLDISPFYLSDSRRLLSDKLADEDEDPYSMNSRGSVILRNYLHRNSRKWHAGGEFEDDSPRHSRQGLELLLALTRFDRWVSQQAIRSQRKGFISASNVYVSVLESLLRSEDSDDSGIENEVGSVRQQLNALANRVKEFEQFGLAMSFPAQQFTQLLDQAHGDRSDRLERALAPHLRSSQAQLDELENLYKLLFSFVSSMNSYFVGKQITVRAGRGGVHIFAKEPNSGSLGPLQLSSGEQQLLLLFCNTIIARRRSKLFIIDEPEISLDVTWQRMFLDTLLSLTEGTGMQFLVATHSIEMLTKHDDSVIQLSTYDA